MSGGNASKEAPNPEPPALQDPIARGPAEVAEAGQAAAVLPMFSDPQRDPSSLPNFSYACGVCGASYDTQWELTRHMDHLHPRPAPIAYICEHCGRGFSKFYRIARHLAAVTKGVAERRGGTATDETRWPGPTNITSRLNEMVSFRRVNHN